LRVSKSSAADENAVSQKRLLYLAKLASPPAISDEPADRDLAVRHPVRPRGWGGARDANLKTWISPRTNRLGIFANI